MGTKLRKGSAAALVAGLIGTAGALVAALPAAGQGSGAFDPGDIIVADSLDSQIVSVDPVTGGVTNVSSGVNLVLPTGVAFADDGDVLVVDRDAFGGDGGVIRIDSVTAAQTVVSNNTISDAAGGNENFADPIAIDRKGDFAYVTDYGGRPSRLIKVDLETGKATRVSAGKKIADPLGVDTSLGSALIADAGSPRGDLGLRGGLLDVNLKSGKQSVVASKGKFQDAGDVVAENKNSALVIDSGAFDYTGAMFRVDLDSGKVETIFKGGAFVPAGLAVESKKVAYVTKALNLSSPGEVYRVNLKTGDRTLLSGSGFNNPLGMDIVP